MAFHPDAGRLSRLRRGPGGCCAELRRSGLLLSRLPGAPIQVSGGAVGGVASPLYVVGGTDAEFFEVDDEGVVAIKFFADGH